MNKIKKLLLYIKRGKLLKFMQKKVKMRKAYKFKGSDEEYLINLGKICLGYEMNLTNPKTYNEKINWYKLNYLNPILPKLVDKVLVDDYIREKGYSGILTPKYQVWDDIDSIDLSKLPNQFVLKTNHDSGGVVIVKDKTQFSINKIKKHMSAQFSNLYKEWPYGLVQKKVFAEELLKTPNNEEIKDYKFFCFSGKVQYVLVCSDRSTELKKDFFDSEWNWMNMKRDAPNLPIHPIKPKNFEKMIEICEKLSEDFPHVRVDLYNIDGMIRFGELTFYPGAGLEPFDSYEDDLMFGSSFIVNSDEKSI